MVSSPHAHPRDETIPGATRTRTPRASASGYASSPSSYWWQHDYFVHSGHIDSTEGVEPGFWLPGQWYLASNGGFDGRWVQLFDDRPGHEPVTPLGMTVEYPTLTCTENFVVTVRGTGGLSPYNVVWTNATPWSAPTSPINTASVMAYAHATVRLTSADGQSVSNSFYFEPWCSGDHHLP
jgi:hypothetical protein